MFDRFMQKYGQKFNLGNPSNMEELADLLHGQMCQMDMLLRSLSEEHRRQLEAAFNSVLQDAELQDEMSKLSQNLQRLSPGWDPSSAYDFSGDQNIGLERALELIADLNHMAELGGQIKKAQQGRSNSSVDMMLLKKYLGEEACQALEQLQSLAEILKRAGYLRNGGTRLELTPKGVRKIGQKALQEVFHVIRKDREGNHRTIEKGIGGDPTEDTHPLSVRRPFQPAPPADHHEWGAAFSRHARHVDSPGFRGPAAGTSFSSFHGVDVGLKLVHGYTRELSICQKSGPCSGQPDTHSVPHRFSSNSGVFHLCSGSKGPRRWLT